MLQSSQTKPHPGQWPTQHTAFVTEVLTPGKAAQHTKCVSVVSLGLLFCFLGPCPTGEPLIWRVHLITG